MKKIIFTLLLIATFFINPLSVFASEIEITTITENNSIRMVNDDYTMDCSNFNDHINMLKAHRLNVINQLKNGEITQEQAVMHIKQINQMINSHK